MTIACPPHCRITRNARLDRRNTFGIAATAPLMAEVDSAQALPELFDGTLFDPVSALILGSGSNLLFAGDPAGAVVTLRTSRIQTLEEDSTQAVVRADAGMIWHELVLWTLEAGLAGLENLALIPGTVGAAPIQNIGAYGVEVREHVRSVEAFDRVTGGFVRLDANACAFTYRDSLFKRSADRYIVTAVELVLSRAFHPRLEYSGIGAELSAMGIRGTPLPAHVAEAVMRIRQRKLPDPARVGNAGSFFKNPLVSTETAVQLQAACPGMPVHAGTGEGLCKISAAWLIDQCGWKGHRRGDAGVAASHALVLVNHGNATGRQILDLARDIAQSVHERFGVALEPEPRIVGATW